MNKISLLGKTVRPEKSKLLLSYSPADDWKEYWMPMAGHWEQKDGWLIGTETGNKGGILFSRESFSQNVMLSFTVASVLPATRDLNAVYCAHWDKKTDYLGESYVCGLNGWYDNKSGIERNLATGLYSTTSLYTYIPGSEVRITCGAIDGHNFLLADNKLICELIDPSPIKGGHVGFSPYCTKLKIKDIEIREIYWENNVQSYKPEF